MLLIIQRVLYLRCFRKRLVHRLFDPCYSQGRANNGMRIQRNTLDPTSDENLGEFRVVARSLPPSPIFPHAACAALIAIRIADIR